MILVAVIVSSAVSPVAAEVVIDVHTAHNEEEEEGEEQMAGRESEILDIDDEDKVGPTHKHRLENLGFFVQGGNIRPSSPILFIYLFIAP